VLDNGAVVMAKESTASPAVTLSAALKAGSVNDPPELLGLAHFLSRILDRGTEARTGTQIGEALDGRGATLNIATTRLSLTLTCTCLVEDVEAILGLVAEVVRHPSFPSVEIETRRGEIATALRQDDDNPAVRAVEGLFALLYRDGHPYGRKAKGTPETIQRVDRASLLEFHRRHCSPDSLSLAIVGDLPVERSLELAERAFGDWRAGRPETVAVPAPLDGTRSRLVIPMMNKAQADIAYGFTTIARHDPRFYALTLVNNVLGQYGLGGRLGQSIRERQGMAYYVSSSFDPNVIEGPLMVRAGVAPASVERAIDSIDAEVRGLVADGITAEELEDAQRYLIGSLPRALETNVGIAVFLQTAEFFSLGMDHDLRLPDLLGAVTLEEANATARALLRPDRAAVVVAGPYDG
jgi:zinc protease